MSNAKFSNSKGENIFILSQTLLERWHRSIQGYVLCFFVAHEILSAKEELTKVNGVEIPAKRMMYCTYAFYSTR